MWSLPWLSSPVAVDGEAWDEEVEKFEPGQEQAGVREQSDIAPDVTDTVSLVF